MRNWKFHEIKDQHRQNKELTRNSLANHRGGTKWTFIDKNLFIIISSMFLWSTREQCIRTRNEANYSENQQTNMKMFAAIKLHTINTRKESTKSVKSFLDHRQQPVMNYAWENSWRSNVQVVEVINPLTGENYELRVKSSWTCAQ